MALVMIMKVLQATRASRRAMHDVIVATHTVVDEFDEDEFPEVPKSWRRCRPRCIRCPIPENLGSAARTAGDPLDRGVRGDRRRPLFVAIAEWAAQASPAAVATLGVTGEVPS